MSKDYKTAFGVGIAAAALWFFVLRNLSFLSGVELAAVVILIPLGFLAVVWIAHKFFHGKLFHKLAKFLMVGMLNTGIDFFIFNSLIFLTGLAIGLPIAVFKSISFSCALINSYELNRRWTFEGESEGKRTKKEFGLFAAVTVFGLLLNVGSTFLIVDMVRPLFGFSQIRWDNLAAAAATLINLFWNFSGYKFFVFKSPFSKSEIIPPYVA